MAVGPGGGPKKREGSAAYIYPKGEAGYEEWMGSQDKAEPLLHHNWDPIKMINFNVLPEEEQVEMIIFKSIHELLKLY